jgi:hypothetical protein
MARVISNMYKYMEINITKFSPRLISISMAGAISVFLTVDIVIGI